VLLARVLGLLVAVALGGCVLMFLLSGERRYLRYAWRIFSYAVFLSAFVLLLMFAERLASEF
jgi:hypothetical protein